MVVYIVGAGPGDPGLVTLKAMQLIRKAEVLIYDKLVNEGILVNLRPDCERIFVGKRLKGAKGSQEMQRRINDLLLKHGMDKIVVRLKGGDPFLFGRGGEEAEALAEARIPFEIVPGIPSPIAVPAYAGIPITHRDHNSSVVFLTGHEMTRNEARLDWSNMPDTLVILMGARNMPKIAARLIDGGKAPDTPVAAIRDGTLPTQHIEITSLGKAKESKFEPPTIFVVGTVVRLNENLSWFEKKMNLLKGMTVALTRTRGHVKGSTEHLRSLGAKVFNVPLIAIKKRRFTLAPMARYDTIVFTSVEGIRIIASKVEIKRWRKKAFFSIGPKTQALLDEYGIRSEIPDEYNSQGLAEFMLKRLKGRRKILLLRSSAASDVLSSMLSAHHKVDEIPLYDILQISPDIKKLRQADIIMLSSASCARSFLEVASRLKDKLIVSIGPMTSGPLIEAGIDHIEAPEHTMDGMIKVTLDHLFASR